MIDILTQLAANSKVPFRSDRLTTHITPLDCHNYVFFGADCDVQGGIGVYADLIWEPIRYVDVIEGGENLAGEFISFFKKKVGFMSFNCVVDTDILNRLNRISMQEIMTVRDLATNDTWNIDSMVITSTNQADVILATVEFRVYSMQGSPDQIAISTVTACCGSLYAGAPFEPCDPDGGVPPQPSECVDFVVGVSVTALPAILATSSGGPGGLATYQWFLDADNNGTFELLVSETAQGLNMVAPGTYRVQVSQGGCSGIADFLFNDPCIGLAIILTFEAGLLIAEPNFQVTAYEWFKPGLILDPTDTNNVYVPVVAGLHTVRVTEPSCGVVEATFDVVLLSDCVAFVYDLVRVDNILEVQNLSGCSGALTYVWLLDIGDGNGFVVIAGESTSSLMISSIGNYRASVNCDNPPCNILQDLLVLDNCVAFKGWIAAITPTVGGVHLTAASMSAPVGVLVNFTWYEWINENWTLVGTGMNLLVPDGNTPANVKLITTAGQCVREDFSHDCIDPADFELYEAFYASMPNQTEFTVTSFVFTQPFDQGGTLTLNQIGAKYLCERNGLVQMYLPLADMATTNEQNVYSYDFGTNILTFPTNNPLFTGDRVSITDTQQIFP